MRLVFSCFFGLIAIGAVRAQVTAPGSPVHRAAERLVEQTQSGYQSSRIFRILLASADPCINAAMACQRTPLPVKLVRFTGQRTDESHVTLFWETSEEVNNNYFEIERTLNPALGYETVATVKGAGTKAAGAKYEITDPNSYQDYSYYRLKQVDFDGSFRYSSVIAVKGGLAVFSVQAFPNPGQGKNMAFQVTGLKVSEALAVKMYDAAGRLVYSNNNLVLNAENQVFRGNFPSLSPGKYNVRISSKDRTATSSFVVIP